MPPFPPPIEVIVENTELFPCKLLATPFPTVTVTLVDMSTAKAVSEALLPPEGSLL